MITIIPYCHNNYDAFSISIIQSPRTSLGLNPITGQVYAVPLIGQHTFARSVLEKWWKTKIQPGLVHFYGSIIMVAWASPLTWQCNWGRHTIKIRVAYFAPPNTNKKVFKTIMMQWAGGRKAEVNNTFRPMKSISQRKQDLVLESIQNYHQLTDNWCLV
jgi:hypothetical protein